MCFYFHMRFLLKIKIPGICRRMSEPKKPPDDFFKAVKLPLKYILKRPEVNEAKLTKAVIQCNKIVIQSLMFMKLYLLHYYKTTNALPTIDKMFINSCMKIVCLEKASGRPPNKATKDLKDTLTAFYKTQYEPLIQNDPLEYTHLNTVLDYLTIDILTMYENNIKLHYVEYVERYVNVVWKKKFLMEQIRKKNLTVKEKDAKIHQLCSELRKIKNDIFNVGSKEFASKSYYHSWIREQKKRILPTRTFKKDSIYYDIQCSPMDYFPSMIAMMKRVEEEGFTIQNVFPMRSEVIPKHIRLDTTTLVHLFMTKQQGNKYDYLTEGNLKRNEDKIWQFFFRTERKCFHKTQYSFHHMIETDGISCTILFLRKDIVGKRLPNQKKGLSTEQYIDELKDYSQIKDAKIVAVDPGKCDLLYCVDSDTKDANEFRYSQDQRRKELKKKKYTKIQLELKKEKLNGKTILDYETELSSHNKKTLQIEQFKLYIQKKSQTNAILFPFYERFVFRKLRLNSYVNTKKSEQKMIKQFTRLFGQDAIVCFGDFEQKKQMKYKEPTIGRGVRKLFKKAGFQTYLVDEFRTSCRCSKCEIGVCSKTMVRENPRPYRKGSVFVHGLIRCKNGCGFWNRDVNGATNIYRIAKDAIDGKGRPGYLSRNLQVA